MNHCWSLKIGLRRAMEMRPTIRQMLKVKRSTLSQAVFTTFTSA
jgi:hypothetical protein